MKEELIEFSTAVLTKEKGFNWEVAHAFVNTELTEDVNTEDNSTSTHFISKLDHNKKDHRVSRPSQSLLQRWLREVHKIHITLTPYENNRWTYFITHLDPARKSYPHRFGGYEITGYETALEAALQNALKLIV